MLSGDNSILQRATDAKTNTDNAQIKERVQLAYTAALAYGKGDLTEQNLRTELTNEFGNDYDLSEDTATNEWVISVNEVERLRVSKGSTNPSVIKLGDAYEDNWIGKTIAYEAGPSGNTVCDWIIIGQDRTTKDVLITTKNPVGSYEVENTVADWCDYIGNLNTACSAYAATIGKNNVAVKQARSITLDDINNAMGFTLPETFDSFTFGTNYGWNDLTETWSSNQINYYYPDEANKIWTNPNTSETIWTHLNDGYYYYNDGGTYKYGSAKNDDIALTSSNLSKSSNMLYILANDDSYWVASSSVSINVDRAYYSLASVDEGVITNNSIDLCHSDADGGYNHEDSDSVTRALRPCIVLSHDIPYEDIKDDIGDYTTYN